jgi:hypothetical protein
MIGGNSLRQLPNAVGSCSVARLALFWLLTSVAVPLALTTCGGGGGGGGAGGSSEPPGIANVTGLSGSNLVLILGNGTNVNVSGNGAATLATGISTGSAYSVTIYTQPINPVQTCSVTGGTEHVGGANANVTVSCVAGTATTVNAAEATVSIDSSVPATAQSAIASILSPIESEPLHSALNIPVSFVGGETLVLAVDSNNNILLASLTTTPSETLTTARTALALVRMPFGILPSTVSASQLNAAIQATAKFSNLVSLINASLSADSSPATSSSVAQSIAKAISQLPSALISAFADVRRLAQGRG